MPNMRNLRLIILILLCCAVIGCSGGSSVIPGNNVVENSNMPVSALPGGSPKLLFVSTREDPGGVYGNIYVGDMNLSEGRLDNIRRVNDTQWMGLYNDLFMLKSKNEVICAMTQGSFLYTDIRAVDFATGTLTTLTDSSERNNTHPVVSFEGKIIYSSFVRETQVQELREMNLDGSGDRALLTLRGTIDSLGISPDGTDLAFVQRNDNGGSDIFTYDLTTQSFLQITNTPGRSEYGVNYNPYSMLLYLAEGVTPGGIDIYSMTPDGSIDYRVTNGEMDYNGPLWQHERWVAFQSGNDIWIHDTLSGRNTNLTCSVGANYSHSIFEEE